MQLRRAYRVAKSLGRSPSGLEVTYRARVFRRGRYGIAGPLIVVNARVSGGSRSHRCAVAWHGGPELAPVNERESLWWHCDCSDFLFTFYPAIERVDSELVTLERPEPVSNRPRRAIDEIGMCKHLMAVVDTLRRDGLIERAKR